MELSSPRESNSDDEAASQPSDKHEKEEDEDEGHNIYNIVEEAKLLKDDKKGFLEPDPDPQLIKNNDNVHIEDQENIEIEERDIQIHIPDNQYEEEKDHQFDPVEQEPATIISQFISIKSVDEKLPDISMERKKSGSNLESDDDKDKLSNENEDVRLALEKDFLAPKLFSDSDSASSHHSEEEDHDQPKSVRWPSDEELPPINEDGMRPYKAVSHKSKDSEKLKGMGQELGGDLERNPESMSTMDTYYHNNYELNTHAGQQYAPMHAPQHQRPPQIDPRTGYPFYMPPYPQTPYYPYPPSEYSFPTQHPSYPYNGAQPPYYNPAEYSDREQAPEKLHRGKKSRNEKAKMSSTTPNISASTPGQYQPPNMNIYPPPMYGYSQYPPYMAMQMGQYYPGINPMAESSKHLPPYYPIPHQELPQTSTQKQITSKNSLSISINKGKNINNNSENINITKGRRNKDLPQFKEKKNKKKIDSSDSDSSNSSDSSSSAEKSYNKEEEKEEEELNNYESEEEKELMEIKLAMENRKIKREIQGKEEDDSSDEELSDPEEKNGNSILQEAGEEQQDPEPTSEVSSDDDDLRVINYYGIQKKAEIDPKWYEVCSLEMNLADIPSEVFANETQFLEAIAPMFFTLLKKHHKWDVKFFNTIMKKVEADTQIIIWENINPKIILYSLLNSSCPELKIKILSDYSSFAPVPFMMPVWKDDFNDLKCIINTELLWILESYYLIVSFGTESLKNGKSFYLNKLFLTEFYEPKMPKGFDATIDIYLDAFKGTSKKTAIIDINSSSDPKISKILIDMANILIVHLKYYHKNNTAHFEEKMYKKYKKPILYIYRDTKKKELRNNIKFYNNRSQDIPILIQKLPPIKDLEEENMPFKEHLDLARKFIFENLDKNSGHVLKKRVFMESFIDKQVIKTKKLREYFQKYDKLVENLRLNAKVLNTDKFLTMVPKHKKWCQIVSHIYHEKEEKKFKYEDLIRMKIFLEKEMKNHKSSIPRPFVTLFMEAASFEESTPYFLVEIATAIKSIIDKEINSYNIVYDKLQEFQLDINCQGDVDFQKYIKENLKSLNILWKKIANLTNTKTILHLKDPQHIILSKINDNLRKLDHLIIDKSFSLEILWRELIYFKESQPKNSLFQTYSLEDLFLRNLRYGYPFEIIDGDNLYFSSKFFKKTLGNMKERILVLSVIGPQSSGKSTLLNFLFGCNFQTSAGRCTRGVYGTFITLRNCDKYDAIFILDTEGLLSIHHEQSNLEFDRKITLFILAVSQVVIINVKGEMNAPLLKLLKICIHSLADLKKNKVPSPEIFIVLNQYTDLSTEHVKNDINLVKKQMGDMLQGRDIGLNDLVTLDKRNIRALPNAFIPVVKQIKDSQEKINYKIPFAEFVDKTKELAQLLIKMAIQNQRHNSTNLPYSNLSRWFVNAKGIWDTILTYSNLVYFQDISGIRDEKDMLDWIKTQIQNSFENENVKMNIMKYFEKLNDLNNVQQVSIEISKYFTPKIDTLLTSFESKFKDLNYNPKGIADNKNNFKIRLIQIAADWESKFKAKFLKNSFERSCKYGQIRLNQTKLTLLARKEDIPKEEIKEKFENDWKLIVDQMQNELDRRKNSIDLLEALKKTYYSIYPMLPDTPCETLQHSFDILNYTQIIEILIYSIKFNENQSFINSGIPPRAAQDNSYSKIYINLNDYFTTKLNIRFMTKHAFVNQMIDYSRIKVIMLGVQGKHDTLDDKKIYEIVIQVFSKSLMISKFDFQRIVLNICLKKNLIMTLQLEK